MSEERARILQMVSQGQIDAADARVGAQIVAGDVDPPTSDHLAHGDVAPLGGPPDAIFNVADEMLILRALRGDDLDGDGIAGGIEVSFGASPFLFDTDHDGLSDAEVISPSFHRCTVSVCLASVMCSISIPRASSVCPNGFPSRMPLTLSRSA